MEKEIKNNKSLLPEYFEIVIEILPQNERYQSGGWGYYMFNPSSSTRSLFWLTNIPVNELYQIYNGFEDFGLQSLSHLSKFIP